MTPSLLGIGFGGNPTPGTNSAACDIPIPATTQVGDTLLALVALRTSAATYSAAFVGLPAGWRPHSSLRRATAGMVAYFQKVADATDAANAAAGGGAELRRWTANAASSHAGAIIRLPKRAVVEQIQHVNQATANTLQATPAATSRSANDLVIRMATGATAAGGAGTYSWPAGIDADGYGNGLDSVGGGTIIGVGHDNPGPGASGSAIAARSATCSYSSSYVAATIVVKDGLDFKDEILADSPIEYLRLGEASGNALDSSGNARDAAIVGSVTRDVAGALINDDGAVVTPGSSAGYIERDPAPTPPGNALTILAFGKFTGTPTGPLVDVRTQAGITGAALFAVAGKMTAFFGTGGATGTEKSAAETVAMGDDQYHFWAGTWNGLVASLYREGTPITNSASSAMTLGFGATPRLRLGADGTTLGAGSGPRYLAAGIDEVALIPSALDSNRIALLAATALLPATIASVQQDLATPWTVRQFLARDSALPWTVRGLATRDLAAPWTDRVACANDLASPWVVRGALSRDLVSPWTMRVLAARDSQWLWMVRKIVALDLQIVWDVATTTLSAMADLAIPWTMRAVAQRDLMGLWTVRSTRSRDAVLLWTVRASVFRDASAPWTVHSRVSRDTEVAWALRGAVQFDSGLMWLVRGQPQVDLVILWDFDTGEALAYRITTSGKSARLSSQADSVDGRIRTRPAIPGTLTSTSL